MEDKYIQVDLHRPHMRFDVINALIEKMGYKSYLEIGVQNGVCFESVRCEKKVGVDPETFTKATVFKTSDQFFTDNIEIFDIIFLDGLHHADQVYKDIINSLEVLSPNGTIIVHDCNPIREEDQIVPRKYGKWNGDVWKAWVQLRTLRPDLDMHVLNIDEGCGIIKRGKQEVLVVTEEITYANLEKNREEWLNLTDIINLKYDEKERDDA